MSTVDEWGRAILSEDEVLELFYQGELDLDGALVEPTEDILRHNAFCKAFSKKVSLPAREPLDITPEEWHRQHTQTWMVPTHVQEIDVRSFVLSLCESDAERDRVLYEMDRFEAHGLQPILQLMIYLVDHFRQNNVVWGVGRGSSVASYVLYKIGVHKVNSLRYGLDFSEFLKES